MQLAWQMGYVDVGQMLDTITPQQFDEWAAFLLAVEPTATAQARHADGWIRHAKMTAEIVNTILAACSVASGAKPDPEGSVTIDDFLPKEYRSKKRRRSRVIQAADGGFGYLKQRLGL